MKKGFKNLAIHESTHEEARYLSKITDRSIASLIEELLYYVFFVACTFEKANLEYSVDGNKVTIEVTGRNNLVVNEVQSPNAKEESKVKPLVCVKFKDSKEFKKVSEK